MKKKSLLVTGVLIALIAAGFFGFRVLANSRAAAQEEVQTATVGRGSLASTLSSSGNTRSGQTATITWQTSGKVGEISLQPGDVVEEDQVLAALDDSTLNTDTIQARQDLLDAQQKLDDLLNSRTQQAQALQAVEDAQKSLDSLNANAAEAASQAQLALAQAEQALEQAQQNRQKMDYPHSSDELVIEKAETDYLLAKQAYKEALQEYNKWKKKKLTTPERVQALNRLVTAEQTMKTRFATYNWYLLDYTENDLAQADAELAVAQANLEKAQADWERLKDGSSEGAIALAEATLADAQREWERVKEGASQTDIEAAQAAVDAAQATLDYARLLAPFTGTITEVEVKTGDLVSAGETAFRIDDLASVYIDLQVSEVDLASLKVGQSAALEFDALPDRVYSGEVTEIGMIGTNSQGVVNYPVTVKVTDADESILPGMTAAVTIVVDQVDDVLLVPNKAIRTSGGQQSVTVLFEGQQIAVPVMVGLVGDTQSEVISDQLREGDAVAINGTTSSSSTTNANTREFQNPGGMLGGLGEPPAGGGLPGGMP
jgi:HlyD family secretion protein